MPQPKPGPTWRERMELLLEGGGHLPGAVEVVDIRHKATPCSVSRRHNAAYVSGQLQVFVYYRSANSPRVKGQGAEVPWHAEVPLPDSVQGGLQAEVVNVEHVHQLDPAEQRLTHTMHITFEVSAVNPGSALDGLRKTAGRADREAGVRTPPRPDANGKSKAAGQATGRLSGSPRPVEPEEAQDTEAVRETTAPAPLPDWAREAAQELMQNQHPVAADTPAWLREEQPQGTNEPDLGQAEGEYTRAGQSYTGPAPDWPRDISFALIEQTLEGVPNDRQAPSPSVAEPEPTLITAEIAGSPNHDNALQVDDSKQPAQKRQPDRVVQEAADSAPASESNLCAKQEWEPRPVGSSNTPKQVAPAVTNMPSAAAEPAVTNVPKAAEAPTVIEAATQRAATPVPVPVMDKPAEKEAEKPLVWKPFPKPLV